MIGWLQPRAQRYRFLPETRAGGGGLPWIIGMMTFLVVLALAGGLAMASATSSMTAALANSFTVQIIEADPNSREKQAAAVMSLLRGLDGVRDVKKVGDDEMRTMLEPWLGAGNVGEELPLPAMIDAAFAPDAKIGPRGVEKLVQAIAPAARLDDHAEWFAPLAGLVDILKWLAVATALLVAAATASIVALSVRAALTSYAPTIETLHMMGAEDRAIAELFQYRYAIYGLVGGLAGFVLALAMILVIGRLLGDFGGGLAGEARLGLSSWALVALAPLFVALITLVTARVTVERALGAQL